MHFSASTLSAVLALAASTAATPLSYNSTIESRDPNTFKLHVWNNCKFVKMAAIYSVTSDFKMVQHSTPTNIQPGKISTINAPFRESGMHLSGHAEWGTDGQWRNQALFEFGYSTYAGKEGTAYDISIMQGSDPDIGMGAYPIPNGRGSGKCLSKTCFPWLPAGSGGWLYPEQNDVGENAPDTVCYTKTDFKVITSLYVRGYATAKYLVVDLSKMHQGDVQKALCRGVVHGLPSNRTMPRDMNGHETLYRPYSSPLAIKALE
ncbi:hypothetical protein LTR56_019519 [Elasticomyces elasticus]|nr:hypothetical protein LTR56_019519 [Elasticomyces elasticus]KAK3653729.1 hypothetical protein LTR22_011107 [Elasticomyces elasticus]KAK4924162.1 hypothetical protein LTR49_008682 [Elasticomyces elasticus]KAK5758510.1 hypothetical protein LTS12_011373 [Elasticomyces elasticus]